MRVSGGEELKTGLEPASVTAVDGGTQVAVLSVRGRVLELFDARTLKRIGRADAGSGPGAAARERQRAQQHGQAARQDAARMAGDDGGATR